MKILMVSDVYFPRVNGVSTSIKIFRNSFKQLGHETWLVAPKYDENTDADPNLIRISSRYLPLDPEDRVMKAGEISRLAEGFAGERFNLLHIHTPFIAHYAGIKLARRLSIPAVETYHTYFEEYLAYYVPLCPKALLKRAARILSRRQCNQVDAVIVPSRAIADVLSRYGVRTPVTIIPTGLDLTEFAGGSKARFCRRFGIDRGRPILVYVGRVAHEKNIGFLIEVVRAVREHQPNILLVIAGEGPARKTLERQVTHLRVGQNVLFVNYLARGPELWDCFCAGDVFVFASSTETQGLVLLEAMALGVPLVSTAAMGTKDIVAAQRGVLVAEELIDDFAGKVIRILRDKDLRARLRLEGQQFARGWVTDHMTSRMTDFYASVIEQAKGKTRGSQLDLAPAKHR